jgi:hypothetical protein
LFYLINLLVFWDEVLNVAHADPELLSSSDSPDSKKLGQVPGSILL